jgi:alpha-amylase
VNYFENGFNSINFEFKYDAQKTMNLYSQSTPAILNGELKGNTVLNYLSSHDDGGPFDAKRTKTIEAGTKLLLSPELLRYFMVMKAPVL